MLEVYVFLIKETCFPDSPSGNLGHCCFGDDLVFLTAGCCHPNLVSILFLPGAFRSGFSIIIEGKFTQGSHGPFMDLQVC